MNRFIAFLVVVGITITYICIFSYIKLSSTIGFGFTLNDIDILDTFLRPILLGVFTIVGILSKIAFDMIEKVDEKEFKIKDIFKKTINSKNAWIAILACPAIIVSFFSSIEEIESEPLVSLMAYQNGFFFKSIIGKDKEKEDEK